MQFSWYIKTDGGLNQGWLVLLHFYYLCNVCKHADWACILPEHNSILPALSEYVVYIMCAPIGIFWPNSVMFDVAYVNSCIFWMESMILMLVPKLVASSFICHSIQKRVPASQRAKERERERKCVRQRQTTHSNTGKAAVSAINVTNEMFATVKHTHTHIECMQT